MIHIDDWIDARLNEVLATSRAQRATERAAIERLERALRFANTKIVALTELAAEVGAFDRAMGTPAADVPKLQATYHDCCVRLRAIEEEERKP